MTRLVIIVLVVLVVGINALYDGKIAEYIGNKLHTWQTSETLEERTAREERRQVLDKQYAGVEACPALEEFARDVGKERVTWRGIWAEVLLENVKATSNRDLVSEYLAAFEKLAFKDSREFDEKLRRIVLRYCSKRDNETTRQQDHETTRLKRQEGPMHFWVSCSISLC